jgi:bifunctional aspartokinase / homoserine dehydrogenase 1
MSEPLRDSVKHNSLQTKLNPVADSGAGHRLLRARHTRDQRRANNHKQLRVMKFGGTSVGNASAIAKVVEIVSAAIHDSDVVVVVSAMSGVTNKLVEVAAQAREGNAQKVAEIFNDLREKHDTATTTLIRSKERHRFIVQKIHAILHEAERRCQDVISRRELTLRDCDAISGIGERLSAPIVAAALAENGISSDAIEATELVVTDSCFGAAEPDMELTRGRCATHLQPLLARGVIPVVTGFIGATVDDVPTTLGRNSSDFSGTIMGAALDADEVTLWTDVDGIQTADPRLVTTARSIPEMSYREAIHLADLGAKVLHPKTMRPVMELGIPLLIRNTFCSERQGTKITLGGSSNGAGARALTTACDLALISVKQTTKSDPAEIVRRTLLAASAIPANVRLVPKPVPPRDEFCIVISAAVAEDTANALRREFQPDLDAGIIGEIKVDSPVAIVSVVEENVVGMKGLFSRALIALENEKLNVIASDEGASEYSASFVVANTHIQTALLAIHQAFHGDFALEPLSLHEHLIKGS